MGNRIVTVILSLLMVFGLQAQIPVQTIGTTSNRVVTKNQHRVDSALGLPNIKQTANMMQGSIKYTTSFKGVELYDTITGRWYPIMAIVQDGLVSGGNVSWTGTGLNFYVSEAVYVVGGVLYFSNDTTVTLSASDPTDPRLDVIGLNSSGVFVLTGTPAADPAKPQVTPGSELELTSILVNAGATTPTGVTQEIIYNENTEWTVTTGNLTANADNTTLPYVGTKSVDVSSYTTGATRQLIFTKSSLVYMTDYSMLTLYVRLKADYANNATINVQFRTSSNIQANFSSIVTISNTNYGYVRTNDNVYQTIQIPISAFTFTSLSFTRPPTEIDRLILTFNGTADGMYVDYINLQGGISLPSNVVTSYNGRAGNVLPQKQDYAQWFLDSLYRRADSVFGTKNGVEYFQHIDSVGAGSSYTFSNGLNESGGAVKLGGALTETTTIGTGLNTLNIDVAESELKSTVGASVSTVNLVPTSNYSRIRFNNAASDAYGIFNSSSVWLRFRNISTNRNSELFLYGDSIQLNPSLGRIHIDTLAETATDTVTNKPIVWNTSTKRMQRMGWPSSGSTVLNNVGTGFDLAQQGTANVKRIAAGTNVTLDSTTTANTVIINASGSASIDSSAVFLGTLFNGKSFSAVTPLLNDGATVVANAGNLDFSGGANTYTQTVNYDQYTALDRWFIKDSVIASEKTGTSYGFGLGLRSYSTQLVGIVANFNMTNDANSGKVTISTLNAGTPTVKATSTALSWSAGDSISLSFERNRFVFTAIVRNITTNSAPITVTYNYVYETNDGVPNTGRWAIFSLGGNFSVVTHRISSRAPKFAKVLFVGDSKTTGQFGDNSDVNWPVKLESNQFNPIVIDAGPSDQLLDMINKIPEIGLLQPKAVVMVAPSNDIRSAYHADTVTNRYDRFVDGVEALGIPVYHMLGFYEPGINQLALIAHIRATYPGSRIIDTYTPTTQSGLLNADNIHPNQAMNDVIVTTVQNSFIIPTARMPYYTLPANTFLPYSTKSTIDTTNGTMSIGGLALNEHSQASDNATFKVRRGTKYWAFTRNGADVANSFALGDTSGTGNFRIYNTTTQTQLGISAATGTLAFVTANTNRYTISNAGAHALTGTTYTYNGSTITNTLTGATVFSSSAANNVFGVTNSVATNLHRFYVSNNGSLGLILSQNGSTAELTGAAQGDMNIRAFTSGNDKRLFVAVGSSSAPAMTFHPTQEVNIGTSLTRDASAKLRIESTTQGFLPPKMTGAQAEAIASPTEGLMVYATDGSGSTITSKGWWGYDGAAWVKLN